MAMADPQRKRGGAGGEAADGLGVQADAKPGLDLLAGDFGEVLSPAELARGFARYRRLMGHDVAADTGKTEGGGGAADRDASAEAFDEDRAERIAALIDEGVKEYINEGINESINEGIRERIDEDTNVHLPRILALAWASYGFSGHYRGL